MMICDVYCSHSNKNTTRKEKHMSEKEKQIIQALADKLPSMSERERGYLEGTIATAAAMSSKKEERLESERTEKAG